jgi:taurine dioxygenase
VGAEISGFDPQAPIDAETWALLSKTLDERGVLVFRDVDLDAERQHLIAEVLYVGGDVARANPNPTLSHSFVSNKEPDGGSPYGRLLFHSDMMWSDVADQIPTLYAVEVAQPSIPTIFTNTIHAWDTLPDDLRARVKNLRVRHQNGQQGRGRSPYEKELIQPQWDTLYDTTTPIALPHPRHGKTMLYVGEQHTREILGMSQEESDALLDELYLHLYQPDFLMEHHWRKGDLVIWDNQVAQHARPYVSIDGPPRTLRKIHAPSDIMVRFRKAATYEKAPTM